MPRKVADIVRDHEPRRAAQADSGSWAGRRPDENRDSRDARDTRNPRKATPGSGAAGPVGQTGASAALRGSTGGRIRRSEDFGSAASDVASDTASHIIGRP